MDENATLSNHIPYIMATFLGENENENSSSEQGSNAKGVYIILSLFSLSTWEPTARQRLRRRCVGITAVPVTSI